MGPGDPLGEGESTSTVRDPGFPGGCSAALGSPLCVCGVISCFRSPDVCGKIFFWIKFCVRRKNYFRVTLNILAKHR